MIYWCLCEPFDIVMTKEPFVVEKYIVRGGKPLHGTVQISGAKNAASAIIPAVILSDEPCVLENVPQISDMSKLFRILTELGAE